VNDVLAARPQVNDRALVEAMEFLRSALASGERPAADVLREADEAGIAGITLRRARKEMDPNTHYLINPTGRFVIGGPYGDAGLTGRKIIVDTYGGMARHGGGAFSGKDPTKVDRSAAYCGRWVAKNLVAAGLASRCEVQIAYAIGVARPVSVAVECFGTETVPVGQIETAISKVFDLRPAAIIAQLNLRRAIYQQTAAYGHFGRTDIDLPWEHTDKVEALKKAVKTASSMTTSSVAPT